MDFKKCKIIFNYSVFLLNNSTYKYFVLNMYPRYILHIMYHSKLCFIKNFFIKSKMIDALFQRKT